MLLSQSDQQQSKISRKDAYKNTNQLSDQINIDGNQYLKKFRKTPETVQVLYILAFIEEHFKKNRIKCRDYLLEAVKICPANHPSYYPIHEMLADNLFNLDEFDNAYKYYLVLLKDKSNPWWTKFAYNASWSLLKLKKFNEALALMLDSYRLSKNPQYKNFSDQAIRNLPNFFVYSDKKGRVNF
jgi:tetratricopeptide (TPR) repeat protein